MLEFIVFNKLVYTAAMSALALCCLYAVSLAAGSRLSPRGRAALWICGLLRMAWLSAPKVYSELSEGGLSSLIGFQYRYYGEYIKGVFAPNWEVDLDVSFAGKPLAAFDAFDLSNNVCLFWALGMFSLMLCKLLKKNGDRGITAMGKSSRVLFAARGRWVWVGRAVDVCADLLLCAHWFNPLAWICVREFRGACAKIGEAEQPNSGGSEAVSVLFKIGFAVLAAVYFAMFFVIPWLRIVSEAYVSV